jgi:phospholipid-binding lipoprotein MlaA
MLPFLGPSNVRDTFGRLGDSMSDLGYSQVADTAAQNRGLFLLRFTDLRADLIATEGLITGERYTFFRSFYMQRRAYLVADGVFDDEFGDEFDEDFYEDSGDISEDFY